MARPTSSRRRAAVRARRVRRAVTATVIACAVLVVGGLGILASAAVNAFDEVGEGFGKIGDGIGTTLAEPLVPQDPVARYSEEQLQNAATIMAAGRDLGLPLRDQAIAVMTAMGESSLRNLDYGDWETSGVTNPDGTPTTSIGLFQQQDGWGSREQRLDPYTAATLFYRAMMRKVPDRADLQPTIVAHRTQINRDPNHYARSWPAAVAVVEHLSGEVLAAEGQP